MKFKILAVILTLIPCGVYAATPAGAGRAGVRATPMARTAPKAKTVDLKKGKTVKTSDVEEKESDSSSSSSSSSSSASSESVDCREEYRECMDEFCLLDESEGERCICSDNIKQSKKIIQEIEQLQNDAEKLYSEGVERERLGAKAKYIFGDSNQAKTSSQEALRRAIRAVTTSSEEESLSADEDMGDALYEMASESCSDILAKCGTKKADMEAKLYQREIVKNCKAFDSFLAEQKTAAKSNKSTAEAAVRSARLEVFDTTNKYNRGECLLAYRACISDKGGCGVNFENCLDADLLGRRANACENVLDQCLASRSLVLQDWEQESKMILAEAAKYVEKYMPLTCNAKIRNCLEEGCSISSEDTGSAGTCLIDINVAAGVCPIINECNEKVPGLKDSWVTKLASLRTTFCQNDVEKCLRNICGTNFTAPECLGKSTTYITGLCPQTTFPTCKNIDQEDFNRIVSSITLQLDYQMLEGCQNYYADKLGRICGTDMKCLPASTKVNGLTELLRTSEEIEIFDQEIEAEAKERIEKFFKDFNVDKTVAECKSAERPSDAKGLSETIFDATKMAALLMLEQRYKSDFALKQIELARKSDTEGARQACLSGYKPENKPVLTGEKGETKSYTYIKSVNFEPDLRNCHVCRVQRVCETGGEKKATSALKAGMGGLAGGASVGTMASPGWGTLIVGAVGAVGGAVAGALSGGQEDFCQEIESCEDINVGNGGLSNN